MLNRRILFISILYLCLWAVNGCSPKHDRAPQDAMTIYMGDPEDILIGTTQVNSVPADFFEAGEIVFLQKQIEFVSTKPRERGEVSPSNVTVEPSTILGGDIKNGTPFTLSKSDTGFAISSPKLKVNLSPSADGSLKVVSVKLNEELIPVRLIHFSATEDLRIFSLLMLDSRTNKALTAFYFARYDVNASAPETISSQYNYTFGAGIKVRWPDEKDIEISICQGFDKVSTQELTESLKLWTDELGDKISVKITPAGIIRPMSDLNQKCVSIIDGYMQSPRPDYMISGITYLSADFQAHTFVDADILLFKSEFKKRRDFKAQSFERWRRRTFIHELGHFFGLDHQFKTAPSIMSYDESLTNQLFFYDQQALRALYY